MATKVLVVEDDSFLLTAYRLKLTHAGFDLQTATDGENALEVLKTFKPDVILMDLIMPRMDGFATLEKIKQDASLKDIPVLVTTNLGQQEDIERVMKLGATDCVTKSDLSLEDLITKIEETAKK